MAVFKMEKNGKITWTSKFRYETWNGEIKQKKKEGLHLLSISYEPGTVQSPLHVLLHLEFKSTL